MNKFKKFLGELQQFSNGEYVIDYDVGEKEFYEQIQAESDDIIDMSFEDFTKNVNIDYVRHCYNYSPYEMDNMLGWRLGANPSKKGAKKVLTYS